LRGSTPRRIATSTVASNLVGLVSLASLIGVGRLVELGGVDELGRLAVALAALHSSYSCG
jgi:hypothetical protein